MENASKALIIAGAILISILLIAVSVYIYNASQDTIQGAGSSMDQQAKNMYNSPFINYIGEHKKGADVKALIQAVIDSNNQYAGDSGKFIAISGSLGATVGTEGDPNNDDDTVNSCAASMSSLKSKVNTGKKYTVTASYQSGIITKINIQLEGSSNNNNN
ncbi:MAG: hypothetical protein IKF52_04435, partial [Clostridia bacterium]|nr:hypothetical protein [Clostridia bacterium]